MVTAVLSLECITTEQLVVLLSNLSPDLGRLEKRGAVPGAL